MSKRTKPTFRPEFRLEVAQLVVDQGYSIREAAEAMNVSKPTVDKWVRQLRQKREGVVSQVTALTPEQRKIQELKKKIQKIEMEKDILKEATALLMSDSLKNSKS